MKKQFYTTMLLVLALAFMPLAFATPLTKSTLNVTYWPVNSGRTGYCLVARLVWYTWNGEMRPIINAKVWFIIGGEYEVMATTDIRGFAYFVEKYASEDFRFFVKFAGNSEYLASASRECLVRMAHQHWNWWP